MEELRVKCGENVNLCAVGGAVVAVVAGLGVIRWIRRRSTSKGRGDYPRDVVILHQIGRGPFAPSLTPFAVKLETYFRIAGIPYQNEHDMRKTGPKRKVPWITYNGEVLADSAFIVEFLNKKLDKDLNSWLTPDQKAVALAFQRMAEENLYWAFVAQRWYQELDMDFVRMAFQTPFISFFYRLLMWPRIRKMIWTQGIGRHSSQEVRHIAARDLTALSDFLGNKKFLMGDRPCEEDCAVFGQLSQYYWQVPGPLGKLFKEDFPRLVSYCERMKDTYWPDWVDCTTRGGTVKATK